MTGRNATKANGGQNLTLEDVLVGFRKHWSTFISIFYRLKITNNSSYLPHQVLQMFEVVKLTKFYLFGPPFHWKATVNI